MQLVHSRLAMEHVRSLAAWFILSTWLICVHFKRQASLNDHAPSVRAITKSKSICPVAFRFYQPNPSAFETKNIIRDRRGHTIASLETA
ncbi:hypothetical protein BC936DRAFT_149353 [Jimgerdemannia flammicorona]|uniref:Uncharacterized protein n=1 Tax=Jimgerdemannia flammicorona TaxID=994334 RepID=A0A433D100_9FUNG|nr:hypothetical protein BC936DRAFT_149353 [Jimgerdemannia flammicorona]